MAELLASDATAHLVNCYSAGHPISDLQQFYGRAVEYWETYAHYNQAYNDSGERETPWAHVPLASPKYHQALTMTCFALLLGKQDMLQRLAPLLDYCNDYRDGLLERLLSCSVDGREPGTSICRRNLPYSKTLAIFSAPAANRPQLMARYLAEWYQSSRREDYFNRHEKGHDFVGYWSWEAAAITLVLGIDDSSYRDMPYYPKDIVDFARAAYGDDGPVYHAPATLGPSELPVPSSFGELQEYWQFKKFSMAEFESKRRSGRMRYESYEDNLEYAALKTFYECGDPDDYDAAAQLAWESVNHLRNCFSAGHTLEDLHAFYPLAVGFWENYGRLLKSYAPGANAARAYEDDDYDEFKTWVDLRGDDYHTALSLVCFAILLGHQDQLARIMPVLDHGNQRRDALLEQLVAPWVPGRGEMPKKCTRGKPYSQTLPLFSCAPEKRAAMMAEYMRGWYDMSENEPYFGTNRKGMQYFGYWSFEAAAITFVLGIDDATYREDRFYPRDLVDFALSRAA
ncbi:PoNe immunity protein domain-containing protein [Pseudoduganella sp.]|uniref:PoNe immunity protein domain-containing protein n=1 Tax=Pseudoduganella sp. TaxID=1880898 RepID=UPI0035AF56C0